MEKYSFNWISGWHWQSVELKFPLKRSQHLRDFKKISVGEIVYKYLAPYRINLPQIFCASNKRCFAYVPWHCKKELLSAYMCGIGCYLDALRPSASSTGSPNLDICLRYGHSGSHTHCSHPQKKRRSSLCQYVALYSGHRSGSQILCRGCHMSAPRTSTQQMRKFLNKCMHCV